MDVLRRLARSYSYVFHRPRGKRLHPDKVRRILIRDVLAPLAGRFTSSTGGKGFLDGRLHSFCHYFISACAANHVPERVVMEWVGHADSDMVRHYFHLHDEESNRQMNGVDFLGTAGRTSGDVSVSSHPKRQCRSGTLVTVDVSNGSVASVIDPIALDTTSSLSQTVAHQHVATRGENEGRKHAARVP